MQQQILSKSEHDQILAKFKMILKAYEYKSIVEIFKQVQVLKAPIRTILCTEGDNCYQGYYILDGTVRLEKKINKKSVKFAQVGKGQIINIESKNNDWKVKYTAKVTTSELRYFEIERQNLVIFYQIFKQAIKKKEQLRNNQQLQIIETGRVKNIIQKKQSLIDKISLPTIQFKQTNQRQLTLNAKITTQYYQGFSMNMNNHKSLSMRVLNAPTQIKSIQLFKNQPIVKPKMKSQKNIINPQALKSIRNEKIFKQQLKNIVKRKIVYENRHLAVLKAFRQDDVARSHKKSQKIKKQEQNNNQYGLDDYFLS